MRNIMNETIYDIITKSLTGSQLTQQEQSQLADWLRVDANADEYAEMVSVWNFTGKAKFQMQVDVDAEWNNFKQITKKRVVLRPRILWAASIAASVALLVGVFATRPATKQNFYTYTSTNNIERIYLPDSSEVILNKNSQLTYKYNPKRHERAIALNGEAMFNVRHTGDEFVVRTKQKVYTKVLGTSFNVKAYADAREVELAVVEGKVKFGSRRSNTLVVKGQQATYDCKKKMLMPTDSLDNNQIAWNTGCFTFNSKPISKVVSQIGNYLNKKVILPNGTSNLQYTGSFENPTSEDFAEIIATAMNWNYTITNSEIIFSKR